MSDLPRARHKGLVVEELDSELLVYDSQSNLAHALEAEAAAVWRACDGRSDIPQLAARCSISEAAVQSTLARLGELGLLETSAAERDGYTRRTALRKIAIGGATVASASAVSSILVPTAAAAGSCTQTGACVPATGGRCCDGTPPIPYPGGPAYPGCESATICCVPAGSCAAPIAGTNVAPFFTCCDYEGILDPTCSYGWRCV